MKVVPTKHTSNKNEPLLPLVPDPLDEMTNENSVSYQLLTNPADPNSPKYKKSVRVLDGSENPRTVLRWARDVHQVLRGLAVTDGTPQYQIMLDLVSSSAAALLRQKAEELGSARQQNAVSTAADATLAAAAAAQHWSEFLTAADMVDAKRHVLTSLLPSKIVAMVKRYLRRDCRKPADMKVRTYYQHLIRINNDELPTLPPFAANQSLGDDEIVDILCFGTPKSWNREMDRQGWDPIAHTPREVVDFLERIETAEDFDGTKVDHSQQKGSSNNKKKKSSSSGKQSKYCMLHGNGSHSTDECHTLKEQAKKMKSGDSSGSSGKKFGNKTWSRKAQDSTSSSKKELAAFIKKTAKAAMKEVHSAEKKRKADSDDEASASSYESAKDAYAFDKKPAAKAKASKGKTKGKDIADVIFETDLKDFNYQDMENLEITDEQSV